jgi:GAF domain-containing protein
MSKKVSKKSTAKRRASSSRESVAALKQTIAAQEKTIAEQAREIREGAVQQAATSEILRAIASSPTDLQPVLNVVAENAARLCDAKDAVIYRIDGDVLQQVAVFGPMPPGPPVRSITRGRPTGRAVLDRQTIHIHDMVAEIETEFRDSIHQPVTGTRTLLTTPLLREGDPIGVIVIRRTEVRPFSEKQIALLKTFADQAVIAIENVRLFQGLKESLEQQTATSEILGVIASSPTDIQPVLNTVAINAARLCEATDAQIRLVEGDGIRLLASYGTLPAPEFRSTSLRGPSSLALRNRETVHVHDLLEAAKTEFPESEGGRLGVRTFLGTPMLREGTPIGVISIRRTEVRPFSDGQIKLLETFASQAVIAIENVRLFKEIQERNAELREALEHQTATAEVLGIISRSPTDVQPVLDAIVESAARVCGIDDVVLRLQEGNAMIPRAHFGSIPFTRLPSTDEPHYRWMREHGALHIPDVRAQNDFPMVGFHAVWRTYLSAPLRQKGEFIGALIARRIEVRPFTPAQIKLLETFADQAVIAIENVRLFQELKESLEQQTTTSQILGVIASSPTDIQPVLDVVAENAARLCDAFNALIFRVDDEGLKLVAKHGPVPAPAGFLPISRGLPTARAVVDGQTIHVHDLAAEKTEFPESQAFQQLTDTRTILATPLLREGLPIGVITIRRQEIRPFTDKQVALLKTFADQAVIAIENVRLFQELQARTSELARSVGELKALGEVGQAVSSTLDLETVLTRIASHAVQLTGAAGGAIYEYNEESEEFHLRGSHQIDKEFVDTLRASPIRLGEGALGQAATSRAPVEVADIFDEREIKRDANAAGVETAWLSVFVGGAVASRGADYGRVNYLSPHGGELPA